MYPNVYWNNTVYLGIKWMQSWSGTREHQEMFGEKREATERVDDRMGIRGPRWGREQVPRSQSWRGINVFMWREALETENTSNLVFFYESRSKLTRWGYIHMFTVYTPYISKWRQLDWKWRCKLRLWGEKWIGAWLMNLSYASWGLPWLCSG